MNLLAGMSIVAWCLFAVALASIIALASTAYDDFVNRAARKQDIVQPMEVPIFLSDRKALLTLPEKALVRGFDSQQLFREDLWVRRMAESRKILVALEPPLPDAVTGAGQEQMKRICAMLAQHAGAKFDS